MKDLQYIVNEIKAEVEKPLQRSGIYYRIFARQKSDASIKKKMAEKVAVYSTDGKKMQDLIGLRVIVYFREDVELLHDYYKNIFLAIWKHLTPMRILQGQSLNNLNWGHYVIKCLCRHA